MSNKKIKQFISYGIVIVLIVSLVSNYNKSKEIHYDDLLSLLKIENSDNISIKDFVFNYDTESEYTFLNVTCNINSKYLYLSEDFKGDILQKEETDTTFYRFIEKYCVYNEIELDTKKIVLQNESYSKKNIIGKSEIPYLVYYLMDVEISSRNQEVIFFTWIPDKLIYIET